MTSMIQKPLAKAAPPLGRGCGVPHCPDPENRPARHPLTRWGHPEVVACVACYHVVRSRAMKGADLFAPSRRQGKRLAVVSPPAAGPSSADAVRAGWTGLAVPPRTRVLIRPDPGVGLRSLVRAYDAAWRRITATP